ncbi:MAG TPA: histidine phosphatase family protein, partial [Vitreimonas sp.]|nr:histidine phosphatase family protein [Vitreimonas sp.]
MSPGPGVRLYLLRHADAGDPDAWSGPDADRPLSEKGVAQAERLGRHLARADVALRQFVSSPKLRARQTAEIVAQFVGGSVALDERLA